MNILNDYSLQSLNTLAVPSTAEFFLRVESVAELKHALAWAEQNKVSVMVLGEGSNVVLPERIIGLVLQIGINGIRVVADEEQHVLLEIGAGENWHSLVRYCLNNNYFGLENLSLIPGTVGAAPIQNIGAYGVELSSVFRELKGVSIASQNELSFDYCACEFDYRDSIFKGRLKNKVVIYSVTLQLSKQPQLNTAYPALTQALESVPAGELNPLKVSEAVIAVRRQKLPDPMSTPNVGSFFKNPIVARDKADTLRRRHPDLVSYDVDSEHVKLAAAWLVDKAGWRGYAEDGVGVHARQALVLVNPGRQPSSAVLDLAARIQASVSARFGITLEIEPIVYSPPL